MIFLIKVKHDLNLTGPMWKVIALCFIKDSRRTAFFVLFFLKCSLHFLYLCSLPAVLFSCSTLLSRHVLASYWDRAGTTSRRRTSVLVSLPWHHTLNPLLHPSPAILIGSALRGTTIAKQHIKAITFMQINCIMCGQMFVGGNDTFDTKAPRLVFSKVGVSKWSVICNIDIT